MRIAALDLGSNSFHLLVVEARLDGSFVPLFRDKEMLRLGDVVAATGVIGKNPAFAAIEVVRRFKAIAESQRADVIVALGTAALREAFDGGGFVDAVREETGIEITIVDGVYEAQLIFEAIRASVLIDRPPALAADLGGGSLELMVGDQNELLFATSVRLGVGRLTAEHLRDDPPTRRDRDRLDQRIAVELTPVIEEISALKPAMLIGSSGTLVSLARMAAAMRDRSLEDTVNQLMVSRQDIDVLAERALVMSTEERARLPGCDNRRAELIPAGLSVLRYLMDASGIDTFTVSEWALREGIVLNAIGHLDRADLGADPRAIRRASVLSLCRRSNWRQPHARQVCRLALECFDATEKIHGLSPEDRELLEFAALLHDIGEHVSRTDHDRHSAYLIENGGLRGFAPNEVRILSCVARFHTRGTPRTSFDAFDALDETDRDRATALVALLRVADGLDSSHSSVVDHMEISFEESNREVHFILDTRGDAELELWTMRRKQELFERTFGVTCLVRIERIGRTSYDVVDAEGTGLS